MEVESPMATFSNQALLEETQRLAKDARTATARLIMALAEVEARRAYVDAGYSSLYIYCTDALYLSEHEAYARMEAARAGLRFPAVLEELADGALTPTNVGLLAPYLTEENHRELLSAARFKTKREVQAQIEGLVSEPVPLYELRFSVPLVTLEKLDYVRDLLHPVIPSGNLAEVFDRALTALAAEIEKKKFGATDSPRMSHIEDRRSRYVPRAVKRKVWMRDQGRCAFRGSDGRCAETSGLEFHHVKPHALGGAASAANLELRCKTHNLRDAEVDFGRSSKVREESAAYDAEPWRMQEMNSVWTEFHNGTRCVRWCYFGGSIERVVLAPMRLPLDGKAPVARRRTMRIAAPPAPRIKPRATV